MEEFLSPSDRNALRQSRLRTLVASALAAAMMSAVMLRWEVPLPAGVVVGAGAVGAFVVWLHQRLSASVLASAAWAALGARRDARELMPFATRPLLASSRESLLVLGGASAAGYRNAAWQVLEVEEATARHREILSEYLGSAVMQEVMESRINGRPALGVLPIESIVVECDLRGFTALSDRLPPEAVVRILSDYYTAMAEAVASFGGRVDSFVGDAVVALLEWPRRKPEAARRAVVCGLLLQRRFAELVPVWRTEVDAAFDAGLGVVVYGGTVLLGNIGSRDRMQYAAVGATVTAAGKLTSLAGPGEVLVGRDVYTAFPTSMRVEGERLVTVPGKEGLSQVYSVSAVY